MNSSYRNKAMLLNYQGKGNSSIDKLKQNEKLLKLIDILKIKMVTSWIKISYEFVSIYIVRKLMNLEVKSHYIGKLRP
jgi:phosphoribosylaminoimidazole carboxylase (NCAIR synthetase)